VNQLSCSPVARDLDPTSDTNNDSRSAYSQNTSCHVDDSERCPFPDGKWRSSTITREEYERMS
jgi:hypothetical protein